MSQDLAEFASKLKKQGVSLCFPLGRSLEEALSHAGFWNGQEVVVRFAPEKLEIWPLQAPARIVDKLRSAAEELKLFRDRMKRFEKELPPVSREEEEEASLEEVLQGVLGSLVVDQLDPAIAKLESASQLAPAPGSPSPPVRRRKPRPDRRPKPVRKRRP